MPVPSETEQIQKALAAGQLSVLDSATGYHRSMYAHCPKDNHDAPVWRTERSGQPISRLVFRCPACGTEFDAKPDGMFLR